MSAAPTSELPTAPAHPISAITHTPPTLHAGNATSDTTETKPAHPLKSKKPRRSCRFRLMNTMLSTCFNRRWREAESADSCTDFWQDVASKYTSEDEQLSTLHFYDPLFSSIDPSYIYSYPPHQLQNMWAGIIVVYKHAVEKYDARGVKDPFGCFFEECHGRLDILYLHMALSLEPKLAAFVLSTDPLSYKELKRKEIASNTDGKRTKVSKTQHLPSAATQQTSNVAPYVASSISLCERPKALQINPPPIPQSVDPVANGRHVQEELPAPGENDSPLDTSFDFVGFVTSPSQSGTWVDTDSVYSDHAGAQSASGNRSVVSYGSYSQRQPSFSSPSTSKSNAMTNDWDVIESRLRKVSDYVDHLFRLLHNNDVVLAPRHKGEVERDLDFYMTIKKKLQAQLLQMM